MDLNINSAAAEFFCKNYFGYNFLLMKNADPSNRKS